MTGTFIKKLMTGVGQAINKTKTNVPTTKIQKKIRDLKIGNQKLKSSKAKLDQTIFEFKNKQPITFKTNKGKSESNREAYKRIQKDNTKSIKGMIDKAFEKKATGGRVGKMGGGMMGRRFGMKMGTPKPKTNVEKIRETFAPKGLKKIDPEKQKGLANLKKARPDVVRKMGYMKKGGRAGFRDGTPPTGTKSGGTRPKPDSLFDPNNPINKRKKQFKEEAKENMK